MLIFCDSFDHYSTATMSQKWDQTDQVGWTITKVAARTGANGAQFFGFTDALMLKQLPNKTTLFIGFALNVNSFTSNSNVAIMALYDQGTVQFDVQLSSGGQLSVTRSGTVLGTSTINMTFGVWHYVEIKAVIDPSAGIAEVKVDGNFYIQLSGQNTSATGTTVINSFMLGPFSALPSGGGGTVKFYYDDLYICDNTGSFNNTYLGDTAVLAVTPSANGSENDFSKGGSTINPNNYQQVNENPPTGDTTYVFSGTVGNIDRYTFPVPNPMTSTPYAAVVWLSARKDDTGVRSTRTAVKSGGTATDGGTDLPLTVVYKYQQGVYETDPATGIAWTSNGVLAAEFGVKVTA